MKFRGYQRLALFPHNATRFNHQQRVHFTTLLRKGQPHGGSASSNGSSQGNSLLVPGATLATIVMLGALHARRLYNDNKIEEAREKGVELEFKPDVKATFLRLLPLRSISRCWGFLTSVEFPVWLRPYVYRAWARAFHSNLEEAALPLEEYASLRDFFVRTLKEGTRPIDTDPHCLISPVDGTVLRFGELREAEGMIEQVKGFSYSVSSLLGASSFLSLTAKKNMKEEHEDQENTMRDETKKSWWSISLASPKVRGPAPARTGMNCFLLEHNYKDKFDLFWPLPRSLELRWNIKRTTVPHNSTWFHDLGNSPMRGLFYCVIYLKPGDYHRVHSPVNWNILGRRHFSGRLYPMNERATRTIRNLYIENERVVLEGQWQEGYMAMAAIGATNIGSIELFIEPSLRTNRPRGKLLHPEPPEEQRYEPEGIGVMLKKGDELAAFNMGSTVVLVFQAPTSKSTDGKGLSTEFRFCVNKGDRIRMGDALGRLHEL